MANVFAIHSVAASLMGHLKNAYGDSPLKAKPCDFKVLSSSEMATQDDSPTTLSLYLYRVTINDHLRNSRPPDPQRQRVPMPLDLHFLLTAWAATADLEHNLLAWAMQQLYALPALDRSILSADAGWSPGDVVQLIPAELSVDDMTRIWDALEPSYRLSMSYIARMVRVEAGVEPDHQRVVARRIAMVDHDETAL